MVDTNQALSWAEETVYDSGDDYYAAVIAALGEAKHTVELESYIFDDDDIGGEIVQALIAASERGVVTRVMVDSFGALFSKSQLAKRFAPTAVQFRSYHEMPWARSSTPREEAPARDRIPFYRRINQRNHRKTVIVDDAFVFAGDINISNRHSQRLSGDRAFRSTGIRVRGPAAVVLKDAFERAWERKLSRRAPVHSDLVWLNFDRRLRRAHRRDVIRRLRSARERVWIRNAYFLPTRRLVIALKGAVANGADVRLILPKESDIFFFPWMASLYYDELIEGGVKILEYRPSPLHAKTMIVDDLFVVGTTNLNRRSLFHDLEADIRLGTESAMADLIRVYEKDFAASDETPFGARRVTLLQRALSYALLPFRHYL